MTTQRAISATYGNTRYLFKIAEDATIYALTLKIQELFSIKDLKKIKLGSDDNLAFSWTIGKENLQLKRCIYEKLFEHRSCAVSAKDESPSIKHVFRENPDQINQATKILIADLNS